MRGRVGWRGPTSCSSRTDSCCKGRCLLALCALRVRGRPCSRLQGASLQVTVGVVLDGLMDRQTPACQSTAAASSCCSWWCRSGWCSASCCLTALRHRQISTKSTQSHQRRFTAAALTQRAELRCVLVTTFGPRAHTHLMQAYAASRSWRRCSSCCTATCPAATCCSSSTLAAVLKSRSNLRAVFSWRRLHAW